MGKKLELGWKVFGDDAGRTGRSDCDHIVRGKRLKMFEGEEKPRGRANLLAEQLGRGIFLPKAKQSFFSSPPTEGRSLCEGVLEGNQAVVPGGDHPDQLGSNPAF